MQNFSDILVGGVSCSCFNQIICILDVGFGIDFARARGSVCVCAVAFVYLGSAAFVVRGPQSFGVVSFRLFVFVCL